MGKAMDPWAERELSLERLGLRSYRDYLGSPLWARIRRKRWGMRDTLECHFCGRKPDQLHHEDYSLKTMRGRKMEALTPVCGDCQRYGSVGKGGKTLTPKEARRRMTARAKRNHSAPTGLLKPEKPLKKKRRRKKRQRRGRGSAGRPGHPFESRFGTVLCGICDRAEETHAEAEKTAGKKFQERRDKHVAECKAGLKSLQERREVVAGGVVDRQQWKAARRAKKRQGGVKRRRAKRKMPIRATTPGDIQRSQDRAGSARRQLREKVAGLVDEAARLPAGHAARVEVVRFAKALLEGRAQTPGGATRRQQQKAARRAAKRRSGRRRR